MKDKPKLIDSSEVTLRNIHQRGIAFMCQFFRGDSSPLVPFGTTAPRVLGIDSGTKDKTVEIVGRFDENHNLIIDQIIER